MPTFNFSLANKESSKRKTSTIEVIKKNIKGIVWIDKKANYSVCVDNFSYSIDYKCFSCKDKERIYRQGEYDKNRVVYVRAVDSCFECNPNFWLPFGVGCVVIGDLIVSPYNNNEKLFVIKECYVDINDEESHKAMSYYKEHIKEINDIIRNRRNNES